MNKKLWMLIVAAAMILTAIFAMAACNDGAEQTDVTTSNEEPLEEELPEEDTEELPEEVFYEIVFTGMEGEVVATLNVKEGETITPPEPKRYEGYVFKGWEMPSDAAVKDMTIKAIYAKLFTISIKISGAGVEISEEITAEEGSIVSDKVTLEYVEGLLPEGHYISVDYADEEFYDRLVEEDILLEIICEKYEYTVTFESGIGGEIAPASAKYGESITLPAPSAEGYIFEGWYTDGDFVQKYEPSAVTESFVLYAKWREITSDTQINLAGDDDIDILIANPFAQFTVTGEIDFTKIANAGITFTGIFDGGGRTAHLGNKPLFKENKGTIRNLNVQVSADNAEILEDSESAYGAICALNGGTIEDCSVEGSINVTSQEQVSVGGVCGITSGAIKNTSAQVTIVCGAASDRSAIGGIAGRSMGVDQTVALCDLNSKVTITAGGGVQYCGGLLGNASNTSVITANTQAVISGGVAGGLFGQATNGVVISGSITIDNTFTECLREGGLAGFGEVKIDGAAVTAAASELKIFQVKKVENCSALW